MRKKPQDILHEKQAKLTELTAQAEAAVELVTRTISGLEMVNQEIDDTMAEIDSYTAQLTQTRDQLSRNRRHNAAVIANFAKLLATDEDDVSIAGEAGEDRESA